MYIFYTIYNFCCPTTFRHGMPGNRVLGRVRCRSNCTSPWSPSCAGGSSSRAHTDATDDAVCQLASVPAG